jgi:ACR3 family arsenite efflux pump ArsB
MRLFTCYDLVGRPFCICFFRALLKSLILRLRPFRLIRISAHQAFSSVLLLVELPFLIGLILKPDLID